MISDFRTRGTDNRLAISHDGELHGSCLAQERNGKVVDACSDGTEVCGQGISNLNGDRTRLGDQHGQEHLVQRKECGVHRLLALLRVVTGGTAVAAGGGWIGPVPVSDRVGRGIQGGRIARLVGIDVVGKEASPRVVGAVGDIA